jgi:carbamoyltransferase
MLLVAPVKAGHRLPHSENQDMGLGRVRELRSTIPAVTHVDYSARVQTVDPERTPRFHAILRAFEKRTGCPVLVNTSFNVRGEPIVNSPQDAYRCFMATGMDALVLEDCVLLKAEQSAAPAEEARAHVAQFQPD